MRRPTTEKPFTIAVMRHSGTHLITPIVRALTGKAIYTPKGVDGLTCIPSPVVIVFIRDPRNWLISAFKWKVAGKRGGAAFDGKLAEFITRTSASKSISYLAYVKRWADRWIDYPGALTVRFEDLQEAGNGIAVVQRIKEFLGEPAAAADAAEVYASVFGKSGTYTGQPSDYREWFGPATEQVWNDNGGDALLKKMGYFR